jgi:hypothetical protein
MNEMPLDGPGYWGQPCLEGPAPGGRHGHTAVYDPVRDRIWMHGGFNGTYLGDLWQLTLGTPMSWVPIIPSGAIPNGRDYASLVYDPNRDRMVLFGGNNSGIFQNDVWVLNPAGPTWGALSPTGTPPSPRLAHRAVFDVARDRMLVVGGYDGMELNDVWALEFSPTLKWTQLLPSGPPPSGRHSATLILDPVRDRLVLFGGYDGASRNDLWELPLAGPLQWSVLAPSPPLPPERHGHGAIYDPLQDLMVVSGGFRSQQGFDLNDSWVLNWGASATPTLVSLAVAEAEPDLVRLVWQGSDAVGRTAEVMRREGDAGWHRTGASVSDGSARWVFEDRTVVPGARYVYGIDLGDGPQAQVEVEIPIRPLLALRGLFPNPASSESRLSFSLPARTRARVDVYDIGGRRVAREDLGLLPAGAHRVILNALARLEPGVYALELVTGVGQRRIRATILR